MSVKLATSFKKSNFVWWWRPPRRIFFWSRHDSPGLLLSHDKDFEFSVVCTICFIPTNTQLYPILYLKSHWKGTTRFCRISRFLCAFYNFFPDFRILHISLEKANSQPILTSSNLLQGLKGVGSEMSSRNLRFFEIFCLETLLANLTNLQSWYQSLKNGARIRNFFPVMG